MVEIGLYDKKNLAYEYSKNDLSAFKKPFKKRGVIYLGMGFNGHEEALSEYKYIIDSLAPDVIAIPNIFIDESAIISGLCDPGRLYEDLRKMSEIYAAKMEWK